jgi:molybdopterin synthase catalytic subunit/molybdopterin converting factor small subunit
MAPMTVTVRLFAILRERAGRDSIELSLPQGASVEEAIEALRSEDGLSEVIDRLPIRMAINREYAGAGATLAPGDELALVPPVSGGAGVHVRVGEEPLSIERLSRLVGHPSAGAIVCFQGTTRDVPRLEYEAYGEMAEERIAAVLTDCVKRHGLEAAAAEHRIGPVPLGEVSVLVAVAAAHREQAFAGAREAIDRIKTEAPIWKREVDASGSRWVEGTVP